MFASHLARVPAAARVAGRPAARTTVRATAPPVVVLAAAALIVGCAAGETRPADDAGTFRLTNALQGEGVALAPVPLDGALPLVRLVVSEDAANPVAHWRLSAFGQGLYRVSSVEAEERLSLAAGYRDAGGGASIGNGALGAVGLDLSRKSASQLWQVVPLGDGYCRLTSALFPDRSLGVAGTDASSGEPRLAASADVPDQRWRLLPVSDAEVDGLPALCTGRPLPESIPTR